MDPQHTAERHQVPSTRRAPAWRDVRITLEAAAATLDTAIASHGWTPAMPPGLVTIPIARYAFDVLAREPSTRDRESRLVKATDGAFDRVETAVDEFLIDRTWTALRRLRTRIGELIDGLAEVEAVLGP